MLCAFAAKSFYSTHADHLTNITTSLSEEECSIHKEQITIKP
jgi:hypothetical protein